LDDADEGGMSTPCATRAWLVLGALTMALEDEAGGWFMTELDLGYPEVRDVMGKRPDADGVYDRTQFMGARAVSASVTAVAWAGARIDDIASRFAPFMAPAARPVLHYVLDRPGAPERVLTLRAANYGFVIDNPDSREIHLQWIAADPVVRDPTVSPLLRIFGPVTAPVVSFSGGNGAFAMLPTLTISGGHFVEVDTAAKSAWADGDRAQNLLSYVDWATITAQGGWPRLPPKTSVTMTMTGQSTSGSTQAQALWNDGYLS
jgi:hypothetical protein